MPSKSHRRGKHPTQGQKRKGTGSRSSPIGRTRVIPAEETTISPEVLVSKEIKPTPTRKIATALHPHIKAELRTIGILSVIMLFILFVLARVLS